MPSYRARPAAGKTVSKAGQKRVSEKISHLHKAEPEKPHAQHIAMAINMEKEGHLGPRGGLS